MLSNDKLREKTMRQFLTAMDVDVADIEVTSKDGLFIFNFKDKNQAERFTNQLNNLLQPEGMTKAVTSITLSEIIDHEIAEANYIDANNLEVHRASCKGVLEVIKTLGAHFVFLPESGEIEITLPDPVYASLLNLLKYPHLTFTNNGKLLINIKEYIKDIQGVIKIEGLNSSQMPLVFVHAKTFEAQRIFYATKALSTNEIEVTPYFFVPETTTPPTYHLVLDVSRSMDRTETVDSSSLDLLKNSVKKLAYELFQYQPDAKVSLTTFSKGIHPKGLFSKKDFLSLYEIVDQLTCLNGTSLYEVTAHLLENTASSISYNNILLFTDGEESSSVPGSENRIKNFLSSLEAESNLVARTKFYVFSYRTAQSELMKEVVKAFQSDEVNTSSADFMEAQKDPDVMKRWAAARELFTYRLGVEDKVDGEDKEDSRNETTYSVTLDMLGQMSALQPRVCQPGERVSLSITDGSGNRVGQSTKTIATPPKNISFAALVSDFGIHASPSTSRTVNEILLDEDATNNSC